jgi:hypothetical protein
MPENLTDFCQAGALAEHFDCQGMSQQMCAFADWIKMCTLESPANNIINGGGTRKSSTRSPGANKYTPRGTR